MTGFAQFWQNDGQAARTCRSGAASLLERLRFGADVRYRLRATSLTSQDPASERNTARADRLDVRRIAGVRGCWRRALSPRISDRASAFGVPVWFSGEAHLSGRRSASQLGGYSHNTVFGRGHCRRFARNACRSRGSSTDASGRLTARVQARDIAADALIADAWSGRETRGTHAVGCESGRRHAQSGQVLGGSGCAMLRAAPAARWPLWCLPPPADMSTICSTCGAENREGRRFCAQCGGTLAAATCPACRAANEPGERFCGDCGAPLTVMAPTSPSTAVEGGDHRRGGRAQAVDRPLRRRVGVDGPAGAP